MRIGITACAVLALVVSASAQVQTLTTTFTSNNGQAGNMFDLVAINDVSICSFDVNLDVGTWDLEIYAVTGGGTYVGAETNPAAWTMLASVTGVTSSGFNSPTPLPVILGLTIPAGTTQGFYVTVTNGTAINYTNGASLGSVYVADANIQFLEGTGNAYPFGSVFQPRIFNGNINYVVSPASCGSYPFQTNQTGSTLDIDGNVSNGLTSAVTTTITGQTVTLNSTAIGPFEIASALRPAIAGGVFTTPGGQVVNVDLTDPSLSFVNGNTNLTPVAHPGVLAIPLTSSVPFVGTGQQVVLDPVHPDGFVLSQSCELRITYDNQLAVGNAACTSGGTTITLGNNANIQQALGFSFSYYGTSYTEVFVSSNGHVTFGSGFNSWASGGGGLNGGLPMIAPCSEDLNPTVGGTISFYTDNAGTFEVCWQGVPSFATANSNDFKITAVNGNMIRFDYGAMGEDEGTVGLSPGGGGNAIMPVNLSTAGGGNGPIAIPPGTTAYEDFITATNPLDLANYQVTWMTDLQGNPVSIQ